MSSLFHLMGFSLFAPILRLLPQSQRVDFRFTNAVLRGKDWEFPLPPFGQGCGSSSIGRSRSRRSGSSTFGLDAIRVGVGKALHLAGGIVETDRYYPRGYDLARSTETDKGVSAVGQDTWVQELQSRLMLKSCVIRGSIHVYLIPVFALNPASLPSRDDVSASLGSDNELVKCLECSEGCLVA
ncbi:hypothetical protein ACFE04_026658 [Oxalis oulophora]